MNFKQSYNKILSLFKRIIKRTLVEILFCVILNYCMSGIIVGIGETKINKTTTLLLRSSQPEGRQTHRQKMPATGLVKAFVRAYVCFLPPDSCPSCPSILIPKLNLM